MFLHGISVASQFPTRRCLFGVFSFDKRDIKEKSAQEICLRLYKHFSQLDKKPEKLIDFLRKVCYNKTKRRKSC